MPLSEYTLWGLGATLFWKSKWIPPAAAHTLGLAKQHTQGIEQKGSQMRLLILHRAFQPFSTWPSPDTRLQHTPSWQPHFLHSVPLVPSGPLPTWLEPSTGAFVSCHQSTQLVCSAFLPSAFPSQVVPGCFFMSPLLLSSIIEIVSGSLKTVFLKRAKREREIRETGCEGDLHSKSSQSTVFSEAYKYLDSPMAIFTRTMWILNPSLWHQFGPKFSKDSNMTMAEKVSKIKLRNWFSISLDSIWKIQIVIQTYSWKPLKGL